MQVMFVVDHPLGNVLLECFQFFAFERRDSAAAGDTFFVGELFGRRISWTKQHLNRRRSSSAPGDLWFLTEFGSDFCVQSLWMLTFRGAAKLQRVERVMRGCSCGWRRGIYRESCGAGVETRGA